jgi:hypothetical protein
MVMGRDVFTILDGSRVGEGYRPRFAGNGAGSRREMIE